MPVEEDSPLVRDLLRLKPDGLSPNGWAMKAGVSRAVWGDMRRHGNPSRRTLEKLLQAAGSSLAEFEMLRVGQLAPPGAAGAGLAEAGAPGWRAVPPSPIPVYRSESAGGWERASEIELIAIDRDRLVSRTVRPASLSVDRDAYAFAVAGDSMWPRFRPGRILIVSPAAPVAIGDDVVVRLSGEGGSALVKELVRRSASEIELRQFNPDCRFVVALDQFEAVEKIVGEAI